ncbi:MAG: VOC family protein [Acidobacteriia bacterium]|nr:VOC family protein [Terriglobia bacterium]
MPESDLIQQLDLAVEAILRGKPAPAAGPEVTALRRVAEDVRALPDRDFRANLKARLMSQAAKEREKMSATTTPVHWIPKGFHSLTPYLHASPKAKLLDFLRDAFGAVEAGRFPRPDGTIMHAQTQIGDSILEFAEMPDDFAGPRGTSFWYFVDNVDETYRRAVAAGGTSLNEPVDRPYGQREGGVIDPAGNYWFISRVIGAESPAPAGMHTVSTYFIARGVPAFIQFLESAFGASVVEKHEGPDGRIVHARIRIGDSDFGMGEAQEQWQPMPAGIHHYVPNVDEAYQRALAAGAKSLEPPSDKPYGDRYAGVIDPQGNYWYLTTHIHDVSA